MSTVVSLFTAKMAEQRPEVTLDRAAVLAQRRRRPRGHAREPAGSPSASRPTPSATNPVFQATSAARPAARPGRRSVLASVDQIAESGHFGPDRGGHIPTTSDADDDPTDVLLSRAREGPKRSASPAPVVRVIEC